MIEQAVALLKQGYTCAVIKEGKTLLSTQRGVAPLLEWLDSGKDCQGGFAADKVVGKAAAYLYVLLGVGKVYAKVISRAAEEVFQRFSVAYCYEESVDAIRNRTGDGFCPMEQAVWTINDPKKAYESIVQKRKELQEKAK